MLGPTRPPTVEFIVVLVGVATGLSTFLGGSFALRSREQLRLILGFSAGAVIGVAIFDLLPEALELARGIFPAADIAAVAGFGFLAYMVLDRASRAATGGHERPRGHLGAASLTVHSFFDGLAIGLAFQASTTIGVVVAVAVLVHDFSDGVNTVNLSLLGGGGAQTARRWLWADAAAPLIGIGASRLIALPEHFLAPVLAGLTGVFLYIGASELLPESQHQYPRLWTTLATVLGASVIYAAVWLSRL